MINIFLKIIKLPSARNDTFIFLDIYTFSEFSKAVLKFFYTPVTKRHYHHNEITNFKSKRSQGSFTSKMKKFKNFFFTSCLVQKSPDLILFKYNLLIPITLLSHMENPSPTSQKIRKLILKICRYFFLLNTTTFNKYIT